MYSFIRFINALVALLVGWGVVLSSLGGLAAAAWYGLEYVAVFELPTIEGLHLRLMGHMALMVSMSVVTLYSLFYLLSPPLFFIRKLFPGMVFNRTQPGDPLFELVRGMANKMGMNVPAIYIVPCNVPNAFAVSKLYGSQVIFTSALLEVLTREELEWVAAHELSHIKHYDAASGAFWMASMVGMSVSFQIHHFVQRTVIWFAELWHVPQAMTVVLLLPLIVVAWAVRVTVKIATHVFRFIDRHIGRQMEYRCDAEATVAVGSQAGIAVLNKLTDGIESTLDGLFASHPSNARRLRNINNVFTTRIAEVTG